MTDLFTYPSLGTLTGAVTATLLITRYLKQYRLVRRIPRRCLVLIVATGVVLIAAAAGGGLRIGDIPLYTLNGLLVAACTLGSWDMFCQFRQTTGRDDHDEAARPDISG